VICEQARSKPKPSVRITWTMLELANRVRVTHPSPESLLPYALGESNGALEAHLAGCAACRQEVERLRGVAEVLRDQRLQERLTATTDCPDELTIANFVDGVLPTDQRRSVIDHLSTCARCRSVVAATSRAVADPAVRLAQAGFRWRRVLLPLGIAAAAAWLLVVPPWRGTYTANSPVLREPAITSGSGSQLLAPRGPIAALDRFVWTSVHRAERYRVRLYAADGRVLWRSEVTDTFALVAANSPVLTPGVTYFWRVEAETELNRWVASDLADFRVTSP